MKNKSNLKLFTVKLIASDKKKIKIGACYTQKKKKRRGLVGEDGKTEKQKKQKTYQLSDNVRFKNK